MCFNFPILLYFLFSGSQMGAHIGRRETNICHLENEGNNNWRNTEVQKSWASYRSGWGPKLLEVIRKFSVNSKGCQLRTTSSTLLVLYFVSVWFSVGKINKMPADCTQPNPSQRVGKVLNIALWMAWGDLYNSSPSLEMVRTAKRDFWMVSMDQEAQLSNTSSPAALSCLNNALRV